MKTTSLMAALGLVVSATALPSLAIAQGTSEEIIVSGRYGRVPESAQTASQAVSYADLDLSTSAGRDELRHRVNLTARFLCDKLGESPTGDSLAPSCRQAAAQDALKRVGTLEAGFAPRGTAWVRPPAWTAPYPNDWATRYP
ncbi:UrcA family protein [Novosphingobium anseongense]|uniref:UrcA family protein n=1 Tax=Novosphingobium anseongense TaxID=3133436 RepID=UPI003A9240E3